MICWQQGADLGTGGGGEVGEVVALEQAGQRLKALDVLLRHGSHHDAAPLDAEVSAVQRPSLLPCTPNSLASQFPSLVHEISY